MVCSRPCNFRSAFDDHQPPRFHCGHRRCDRRGQSAGTRRATTPTQRRRSSWRSSPKSCWSTIRRARPVSASTQDSARLSRARLSDRSAAGQQAIAQRVAKRLERLKAIDTARLGEAARIDVDVMRTAHEFAAEGFAFPYGDVGVAQLELVVSQRALRRRAEHRCVPRDTRACWTSSTPWRRREDADAYLSRLEAYAGQLDGETGRLQGRGGAGRDRAGFPARQDAEPDQDRARRQHRRLVARARRSRRGRRTCRATTPARPRRLRRTKSRRRSIARSPSWKRIASAQPAMRASGSCRGR